MATIDITANMLPSRYDDETDRWDSADQFNSAKLTAGDWIELRMHCRYTRRTERFSVLYQGPGGSMRIEHGADEVPGPLGCLIPQASMIASSPVAKARYIDVQAGDVLVINNQRMVILDDRPHDYPRLVSEVEAGLASAQAHIRRRMLEGDRPEVDATELADQETELELIKWNARRQVMGQLFREIGELAPALRQAWAAPAKR